MSKTEQNEEAGKLPVPRKKVFSLLGLAARAGKIASGEFMTEKSVKGGTAALVITAEDASDNTKKNFTDMGAYYKVPVYLFGSKEEIGHSIGKEFRASLAVNDRGFAQAIEKLLLELDAYKGA